MAEDFLPLEISSSVDFTNHHEAQADRERIKHILIGSPILVKGVIQALHVLGYAEATSWSRPVSAGHLGNPGEVMAILMRYILLE